MALGSVAVSGGMSQKERERLMYMDGKLIWSSSGFSSTAPENVDYVIVKCPVPVVAEAGAAQNIPTEIRVARGCKGSIGLYQQRGSSISSGWEWNYATITFATDGKISMTYPGHDYKGLLTLEGYQYI